MLSHGSTAAELNREYEAVMHVRSSNATPILDDKTHVVGIASFRGLAVFSPDDIAVHRYEGWFDLKTGAGAFHGYALWTFDDGAQLRADYSGEARDAGDEGFLVSATFRGFSGTGRYKGVTGTGSFAGRRVDAIEQGGSTYLKGKLMLTLPD